MVYITPHSLHHPTRFTSPHMVYITPHSLHHHTRFTSPHTVYFTTLTDSDLISTIIDHNNNLSHKKWFTSPHTWITTPNYQCKFTCSPPPLNHIFEASITFTFEAIFITITSRLLFNFFSLSSEGHHHINCGHLRMIQIQTITHQQHGTRHISNTIN